MTRSDAEDGQATGISQALDAWRDSYWQLVRGNAGPGRLAISVLAARRRELGLDEAEVQDVERVFRRAFDDFEDALVEIDAIGSVGPDELDGLEASRVAACISRSEATDLVRAYGLARLLAPGAELVAPGWFVAAIEGGVRAPTFRSPASTVPHDEASEPALRVRKPSLLPFGDADGMSSDAADDGKFEQRSAELEAAGRWESLVELYVARVETRDEVREQTALLRKVAEICLEKLRDPAQAYDSLETAFTLDVTDEETIAPLERLAASTKRWSHLVHTANALLEDTGAPLVQVALCLRLAKWYEVDLGRKDYAAPLYARVLELEPNNVQARRKAATYLYEQGDWRGAGQRLEEALAFATRNTDRAAILTDIGDLLERFANDGEQAFNRYQRALEMDADYVPALDALERIYDSNAMTAELGAILERKVRAAKDPGKASDARLRLATLIEGGLGSSDRAISLYLGVIEHDASNLPAFKGLERLFVATKRWQDLVELVERRLAAIDAERERSDLLVRLATLRDIELQKPTDAVAHLEEALELAPTNLAAFEALARSLEKLGRKADLAACLERHADQLDGPKKAEILARLGHVLADDLREDARAVEVFLTAVAIDPDHVAALSALAKIHERMGDSSSAIEYAARVAELASDGSERVESHYRIGKQLLDAGTDLAEARSRFQQALELDAGHLPTLAALRLIMINDGDLAEAARLLDAEQERTSDTVERAKLLVELGRMRAAELGQIDAAVAVYRLAFDLDATNQDAAYALANHYLGAREWEAAEPYAAFLQSVVDGKDRAKLVERNLMHGRVQIELKKGEEAVKAYAAASRADLMNREANRGLGDANFLVGDWAGAHASYQKVLTALADDESGLRAEILHQVGCVKREQAQVKQAIYTFEKALQLVPGRRATLEALADIHAGSGDWPLSCNFRQSVIDGVTDEEERQKLLLDLADTWESKAKDDGKAIVALEQVSKQRPDDNALRHRLLALYQKNERWDDVVRMVRELADGDPSPKRRARYFFTMGQVVREKLQELEKAADLFDKALDLDPDYTDAYERNVKMLAAAEAWTRLESAYRRMLDRIVGKGNVDLEYTLNHELGVLYRDQLQDVAKADEAFRAAIAAKPDAVEERVLLAQLAVHTGDAGRALEQYRSVLANDPLNADAYRSIYTLHVQEEAYDQAWCVAGVMRYLGFANEEEAQFYTDWKPEGLEPTAASLDASLWARHLVHEDEDPHIGKIFEAIAPAALRAKVTELTAKNRLPVLPENLRQDPASAVGAVPKTFWWAAKALGLPSPQLYVAGGQPGLLTAVPIIPLATVAGQNLVQGITPFERAFLCGRHLAMYRGEHLVKLIFPTVTELTVLLFGAIRLVSQIPVPPEVAGQVQSTTPVLGQFIEPIQREALKIAVNGFIEAGGRVNLRRWSQAVETTAFRAGLLLSADLGIAQNVIVSEPQLPGDLTPPERMKDLMLYTVSDSYAHLRKHLGLAIRPDQADG
ncbi:MAG: tetratricopeptide repeat protein [Deltaproteobacteria bacterium]|nr:tetratricopeptide repeat protein [Deltaproteobacteria bacterium]